MNIADIAIAEYENECSAGITSFESDFVLQTGNAFNYTGEEINAPGNMYTHVTFALGAEDVTANRPDPNVGNKPNVGNQKPEVCKEETDKRKERGRDGWREW